MKTNRREHHQLGCVVSAASIHGSVGILPGLRHPCRQRSNGRFASVSRRPAVPFLIACNGPPSFRLQSRATMYANAWSRVHARLPKGHGRMDIFIRRAEDDGWECVGILAVSEFWQIPLRGYGATGVGILANSATGLRGYGVLAVACWYRRR